MITIDEPSQSSAQEQDKWLEELCIEMEKHLLKSMGVNKKKYVIGVPGEIRQIDEEKTKPDWREDMWL